jgi:hypothetical protein
MSFQGATLTDPTVQISRSGFLKRNSLLSPGLQIRGGNRG